MTLVAHDQQTMYDELFVLAVLMNAIVVLTKQGLWQVKYTLTPASSYDFGPDPMS